MTIAIFLAVFGLVVWILYLHGHYHADKDSLEKHRELINMRLIEFEKLLSNNMGFLTNDITGWANETKENSREIAKIKRIEMPRIKNEINKLKQWNNLGKK